MSIKPANQSANETQFDRTAPVPDEQTGLESAIQQHIDRGLSLYTSGLIHEAFLEFLRVLALDLYDPLGHYLCGVTLQALELQEMALDEWTAASSLSVCDGDRCSAEWDWIKSKSAQFLTQAGRTTPSAAI